MIHIYLHNFIKLSSGDEIKVALREADVVSKMPLITFLEKDSASKLNQLISFQAISVQMINFLVLLHRWRFNARLNQWTQSEYAVQHRETLIDTLRVYGFIVTFERDL